MNAKKLKCLALFLLMVPTIVPAFVSGFVVSGSIQSDTDQNLPVSFIENEGQYDPQIRFIVKGPASTLFFTPAETVIVTRDGTVFSQSFERTGPATEIAGAGPLSGQANFFIGNDPAQWHPGVPVYEGIVYHNLYDGIDVYYNGTGGMLKREFIVYPGADPSSIHLHYNRIDSMAIDNHGALVITSGNSTLTESPLICYQVINGHRITVPAGYQVAGAGEVRFLTGEYNPQFPLVIDPALVYSTYLGGSDIDLGSRISMDNTGNIYITGTTYATGFPTTAGSYNHTFGGNSDIFVTKLDPSGATLVFSTFLGGSGYDSGEGIAVDNDGNVYVTGETGSPEFPTTTGAYDRTYGGGDAFITKLDPTGSSLLYSTFLGGGSSETGSTIAVDSGGDAYVTGYTFSDNFPTTGGAYNRTFGGETDVFVTKLNPSGTSVVYSTYIGGLLEESGSGIVIDSGGNAFITGNTRSEDFPTTDGSFNRTLGGDADVFVLKLDPSGSSLLFSTFLGGSDYETCGGIALDSGGNVYIAGRTDSANFPTTAGAYNRTFGSDTYTGEIFVTKLYPTGSFLMYSTFLGNSFFDTTAFIAVADDNTAYISGTTSAAAFPTTEGAFNRTYGGNGDAFVTRLNTAGSLPVYSTYLGGTGTDYGFGITVDNNGTAVVTGMVSAGFPTSAGAYDRTYGGGDFDAFVAKLSTTPPLTVLHPTTPYTFRQGDQVLIEWKYAENPGSTIKIELLKGSVVNTIINTSVSIGSEGQGSYSWTVPINQPPGTDYQVKISSTANPLYNDTSDAFFEIEAWNGIHVTAPDGGEKWAANSTHLITWEHRNTGAPVVQIELFKNGVRDQIISTSAPIGNGGVGSYSWSIQNNQAPGDDYTVRVWSNPGGYMDNSDGPFTITSAATATMKIALFRPSTGFWYFDNNLDGFYDKSFRFGNPTDRIITGDWDGDGNDSVALFRPSTGFWYFDYNLDGFYDKSFRFGGSTDQIVKGDWNGDRKDEVAIFRPSTGFWYFDNNLDGFYDKSFRFGNPTDRIITGDWDGEGNVSVALFRPSTGFWYFDFNLDGKYDKSFRFGGSTDQIVKGDWNGDRKDEVAIFRPSTGFWYFDNNLDGFYDKSFRFGNPTDQIITGDWDGDGNVSVALFRPSTGFWYFDFNLDGKYDKSFRFGGSTDRIIAGKWI